MADRTRKTWRATFKGLNTRLLADALPPGKYAAAINVRADGDSKIRTRPGYTAAFSTGVVSLTDIGSYAALGTDNAPRIIVHDSTGGVWLDNGVKIGQVGTGGTGASLIPFRPSQSPQSWMYVGNSTGYQKFSAPGVGNAVTTQKVGIAEPQSSPEVCPDGFQYNEFTGVASAWVIGGTAGTAADATRSTDTVTAVFADPASVSPATKTRYSVQISAAVSYGIGETLKFNKSGGGTIASEVEDVYPPINNGTALTVQAIYYFTGTTGRCVFVPSQFQTGSNNQQTDAAGNPAGSIPFLPGQIAGLRRGSLISLNSEVCFVLSVTSGPQGQLAIEVTTTGAHGVGETFIGVSAICCSGLSNLVVGQTVTSAEVDSTIQLGVGTLTKTLSPNPFGLSLGVIGTPQENDYIHVSIGVEFPADITQLQILFDVGDGSFTENVLYYAINPSSLAPVITGQQTQLQAVQNSSQTDYISNQSNNGLPTVPDQSATSPAAPGIAATGENQFTEAIFAITDLTRIGNDQTKTLVNCNAIQISINTTAAQFIAFGSIWVGGGGQPDVGTGTQTPSPSLYFYRVRPRSSLTGAVGNPSPEARYGVSPLRQPVIVSLPSASYDTQIDTWDIERYGGTLVEVDPVTNVADWHLIGSTAATASTYVDNVFDDAANAGDILSFDNFEPWPTVDQPWVADSGSGGSTGIHVTGTAIVATGAPALFPATIARWLPGTLLTLNGQNAYTLNKRPVAVSGGYLFRINENAGSPVVTGLQVNEPDVANQPLPYLWGPDSNGIMFGCGDPYRPGALYSSTVNNPDSTPNNIYDLVPPSEPLMGGEIIDGLSMVASSRRWWQLQGALSTPQRWNPVETPAGRGLAAPMGVCTDGKYVYFVAKDGVYYMIPGLPAVSLTDVDLKNLFPRDGVPGQNQGYASLTVYAPDYQYASRFRLSIINNILRFHYFDSNGFTRILALDMTPDSSGNPRMAWSDDIMNDPIVVSHQPDQPPGSLITTNSLYAQGYFADVLGKVWMETDLADDNNVGIGCGLAVPEWDAGDGRTLKQWLDSWVDVIPAALTGLTVTPVSGGGAVGSVSTIAQSSSRLQSINPIGSSYPLAAFLGLLLKWTDDFATQSVPTQIFQWSEEFVPQPVLIRSWQSVPTSHGMKSYHHVRKVVFAYMSTASVTLTITAFDGTSPSPLTLPSTSGAYQKVEFVVTFNKGLLYTYKGTSPQPWTPILEDCEIYCGAWERSGPYSVFTGLGGAESQ